MGTDDAEVAELRAWTPNPYEWLVEHDGRYSLRLVAEEGNRRLLARRNGRLVWVTVRAETAMHIDVLDGEDDADTWCRLGARLTAETDARVRRALDQQPRLEDALHAVYGRAMPRKRLDQPADAGTRRVLFVLGEPGGAVLRSVVLDAIVDDAGATVSWRLLERREAFDIQSRLPLPTK